VLLGQDNQLLASGLELLEILKRKISESNGAVTGLARGDERVKLLRSIPGLVPFFSVLVANKIDDITRFRDEKKLCAYAGLVPSTYSSGGKVFHGRITKTGNKWLRCAFIEAVQPAISSDADLYAYYQRLRIMRSLAPVALVTS